MILEKNEADLFFSIYWNLLLYCNNIKKIKKNINSINEIISLKEKDWFEIRNVIFSDVQIIYNFIKENSNIYNKEEIEILENWALFFIKSDFFIIEHTKTYSIFMDSNDYKKIYPVTGLTSFLDEIFPKPCLPVLINTILLPFKNKIIYDGLIVERNLQFGSNITFDIKENYKINNAKYGLTSDLTIKKDFKNENIEELLTEFLKKPEFYEEEINELIYKNDNNLVIYSHLISKNYLKKYKKEIKELSIKDKYYLALYFGNVIQTSFSELELKESIAKIIPDDKIKFIYICKL